MLARDGEGDSRSLLDSTDLLCYLVALMGSQLATIEIDLSIFGDETHHLMICGRDSFHAMQPSAPQDGVKGNKSSTTENCTLRVTEPT